MYQPFGVPVGNTDNPWLTLTQPVRHSVLGSSLSMVVTVRRVTDWLGLLCLAALFAMAGVGSLAAQSQDFATPQQTNERIQQLAALARTSTADPPLGPGDLIHIDVFDIPELSHDLRVSNSGVISFPLMADPIPVAGLTPFELERQMEQLLSADGLVAHPQVSIFVKEQASQPVTIVGAIGHPTVMQISRPTSLLELLANAGGITDEAGSTIMITRADAPSSLSQAPGSLHMEEVSSKGDPIADTDPASQTTTITIRLQDLLDSGNPDFNIQVRGGDIVSVPRAGIVYVLGFGVAQQGEYVLQAHGDLITALKAVALAHGMTTFAKGDSAVIMRNDPKTGNRIEIPVHLKQIQNHKAADVPLQSNDILYVPDSRSKKALAQGTATALGIGTGLAIYRVQ
jgi:polysaccharide biosynthesis/export protein